MEALTRIASLLEYGVLMFVLAALAYTGWWLA